jgi:hypothetical protein
MLSHMVLVGSPTTMYDQLHCIFVRLKGWRWPHNPGITAAEILTSAFFYNPPGPRCIHFCCISALTLLKPCDTVERRTHHTVLSQLQDGASTGHRARS